MPEYDRDDVLQRLSSLAEFCRCGLNAKALLLVGSYAKGTYVRRVSDVDVIVVADGLPDRFLDRLSLLDLADFRGLPVEALIYTPGEFRAMLDEGRPGVVDAVEHGIALLGGELLAEMRLRLEQLKKQGLARTAVGIRMPRGQYLG